MRHLLAAFCAALAIGICAATAEAQSLLLEWSDRPDNPQWMSGDPVSQRTLSCWVESRDSVCKLTVVTIGRASCPVALNTDAFRTDTGDLKVSRTPAAVDLEFADASNTWTLHLKLVGGATPIVEQASGIVATKALLPADRIRSSRIVALVQGTKGIPGREYAEVDLKCTKVSVVAAKRESK